MIEIIDEAERDFINAVLGKKKSVDHWRTLNFRRRDCMSGVSFPASHHRGD